MFAADKLMTKIENSSTCSNLKPYMIDQTNIYMEFYEYKWVGKKKKKKTFLLCSWANDEELTLVVNVSLYIQVIKSNWSQNDFKKEQKEKEN